MGQCPCHLAVLAILIRLQAGHPASVFTSSAAFSMLEFLMTGSWTAAGRHLSRGLVVKLLAPESGSIVS